MIANNLPAVGDWLQKHAAAIRWVQALMVVLYAVLVIVPTLLPLPDENAHIVTNLTVFAQFIFWGVWWPFVLLSMVLMGRVWCGLFCPEGALSEWVSARGQNRAIPRWMRWNGWSLTAFVGTTVYGQMVSVYQYPKAVLLVLGGSTAAALVVGYLYGREKRVWCKYLCPVNGVFGVLSKLAPMHFAVNPDAWRTSYGKTIRIQAVNCAPLVALRRMEGVSDCHMCGRCSGHRDAITLRVRSPSHEIVHLGSNSATGWQAALILFGLLGVAIGAFQWNVNPHFIEAKQSLAEWLMAHDVWWPFAENAPGWLLVNYPEQRDVFSWLDGFLIVGYILGAGGVMGGGLAVLIALASRALGSWKPQRFYHLSQALIPLAGCGVFLGLSALTINLLKSDGVPVFWANDVRFLLLAGANLWSAWLARDIGLRYEASWHQRLLALVAFGLALVWVDYSWWLMFWAW